ncbi:hypothetical protein MPLDJ20_110330 [Mesorhizobium plurifarium]|uniref:Uncharacterized protein n=1 Tax=Mesorhizobium plurifarium TaxID=69974 RepID=A0A090E0N3_MESPL|nr:hypothetical protein MPLDJ20_110330 [Mesorhizobium plurifarium]
MIKKGRAKPDLLQRASEAGASTSVVKNPEALCLGGLQVFGRTFAVASILHDVEADLLALDQRAQSSALHGRDVHEHVGLAAALLDKAEALGGIEKLHGPRAHCDFLSNRRKLSSLGHLTKRRILRN